LFQGSNEAFPFCLTTRPDTFLDAFPAAAFAGFPFYGFFGCEQHFENSIERCGDGKQQQCCRYYDPVLPIGQLLEMAQQGQSVAECAAVESHRPQHAGAV
jgi:hypothetical protein